MVTGGPPEGRGQPLPRTPGGGASLPDMGSPGFCVCVYVCIVCGVMCVCVHEHAGI